MTPAPTRTHPLLRAAGLGLAQDQFVKLVLAKPRGAEPGLERVEVRRLALKGGTACPSCTAMPRATSRRTCPSPTAWRKRRRCSGRRSGTRTCSRRARKRSCRSASEGNPPDGDPRGAGPRQRPRRHAQPRKAALDRPVPAVPGRTRRDERAAPARARDGAQVEADQQVRRGVWTMRLRRRRWAMPHGSTSPTSAPARAT